MSVKDKKWEYEKERRYVLFLYDSYEYVEINDFNSDDFLKIKTSLLLYPDFILSKAKSMIALVDGACEKRFTIYQDKKYRFCENCLSFDFDNLYRDVRECPICGSSEYYMFDERGEYIGS